MASVGDTFLLAETTIKPEDFQSSRLKQREIKITKEILETKNLKGTVAYKKSVISTKSDKDVELKSDEYKLELVWRNVIAFILLHIFAAYGAWIVITEKAYAEMLWPNFFAILSGLGITAGAHRLWSHRSYKAKLPLRIILMFLNTTAFQNCIHEWVRDHRVHHKYTDTNADPHNAKRGFFFSHMGWLLCKKHPDVKTKGKCIDMSDLEADPVVMFQKKYYLYLMPFCTFVLPGLVPYIFFGSSFRRCFFICSMMRYVILQHSAWLVNSAAHLYGMRPYDKNIGPADNKVVAMLAYGEGWHNYHHVFPWDYKTAELGDFQLNITKGFIDIFVKIGWAYDLKTVSNEMIIKRVERTGDGSHEYSKTLRAKSEKELILEFNDKCSHDEKVVWGWDDPEMPEEDKKDAKIINKEKKF